MMTPETLLLVAGAFVLNAWLVARYHGDPEPGTIEHVDQLYREGEISFEEQERRKAVIQDPRADRIREETERVSGIGEKTSWDLAAEFESVDDLADASREDLEAVPNVGPERAAALEERFQ
jgi:ERCC4-type nuclease